MRPCDVLTPWAGELMLLALGVPTLIGCATSAPKSDAASSHVVDANPDRDRETAPAPNGSEQVDAQSVGNGGQAAEVSEAETTEVMRVVESAEGLDIAQSEDAPVTPAAPSGAVTIDGRRLLVGNQDQIIKGVCWNPVPVGSRHPEGLDFARFAEQDIALMQDLGINVVRTYEPLVDRQVLDRLAAAGIRVINTVYAWGGSPASIARDRVVAIGPHPAILMWTLGNEWNYNGLYVGLSHAESLARLNEAAALIKEVDSTHPIATVYGEVPSTETVQAMTDIDVWGINSYRGISFGDLFSSWSVVSTKPMFIGEYGADAHNSNIGLYDPDSQADATEALTREILEASVTRGPDGVTLGGTLFEFADEWWKDEQGALDSHDIGGIAPGGGPYPDQVFNEEWWGIVDVDRTPRPAFERLRAVLSEY